MRLRADFDLPETVRPEDYDWVASPASGVERMMLDRVGDEVARATTIVRFAPGSRFDAHTHGGGEEFLVLEGVFSDETGDFPAGTYVRNPIGTNHTPHTDPGCTILVKLHQFDREDTSVVRVDTRAVAFEASEATDVETLTLHRFGDEDVRLIRLAPGALVPDLRLPKGGEVFVLEGSLDGSDADYPAGSWLRQPAGANLILTSRSGAVIFLKTGHLPVA